jgi:hypothetical protein
VVNESRAIKDTSIIELLFTFPSGIRSVKKWAGKWLIPGNPRSACQVKWETYLTRVGGKLHNKKWKNVSGIVA